MKTPFKSLLVLATLACLSLLAETAEYMKRPLEIINGEIPAPTTTIWNEARNGYKDWKVEGNGTLESGDAYRLWNDTTAKVTFTKPGKVTLKPADLQIDKPVTGIAFWIIASKNGKTKNTLTIQDAKGKSFKMTTRNNSSFWANSPWWCTSSFLIPAKAEFPVKISRIEFETGKNAKDGDTIYFDFIHTFKINPVKYPEKYAKLPYYLTTKDTILPTPPAGKYKNSLKRNGKSYVFSYKGADGTLQYIYTPQTGTLGDFKVKYNDKLEFTPMADGGIIAHKEGVVFKPTGEQTAKLTKLSLKNNTLTTQWNWEANGQKFDFTLSFEIKGRSLVINADCQDRVVTAFDCGIVKDIPNPRLFGLTYLNYRWDYPRLLVNKDCFVSLFPDWYTGNFNEVVDAGANGELPGAKILDDSSARILGGVLYRPANRGEYTALHERFFLTISPNLEDVMPNNPNPKSKYFDLMSNLICHTRMYPVTEPKDVAIETAYCERLKAYGMTDIFYRTHYNEFRTPIQSNNFTFSLTPNQEAGGEESTFAFYKKMREIFPIVGPYQDNRVIHPLCTYFNYDHLAQWLDDTIMSGWDGAYQLNPVAMRMAFDDFLPKFVKKYGWNGCYLDETTNTPPWGLTDSNRYTPGATTSKSVLFNYGKLLMEAREHFNGPIWSEGNADFFWTGCLDTDYAQCNLPDELPIPDYKIRKMNPLENLNGYDLTRGTVGTDYLVSAQIVNGNIGHIWGGKYNMILGQNRNGYPADATREVCKSYFMMRQLQPFYTGVPVSDILYQCGDKLVTATEMLRGNLKNEGKVFERYSNGLQIWVNRNTESSWTIKFGDQDLVLPPYGYAALLPGKIIEYSAEINGHRVDYSNGPRYIYVDGRNTITEFPGITAANAYVIHKTAAGNTLTPVPFISEEDVSILATGNVTPLAQDGTACGKTSELKAAGNKASIHISPEPFKYLINK